MHHVQVEVAHIELSVRPEAEAFQAGRRAALVRRVGEKHTLASLYVVLQDHAAKAVRKGRRTVHRHAAFGSRVQGSAVEEQTVGTVQSGGIAGFLRGEDIHEIAGVVVAQNQVVHEARHIEQPVRTERHAVGPVDRRLLGRSEGTQKDAFAAVFPDRRNAAVADFVGCGPAPGADVQSSFRTLDDGVGKRQARRVRRNQRAQGLPGARIELDDPAAAAVGDPQNHGAYFFGFLAFVFGPIVSRMNATSSSLYGVPSLWKMSWNQTGGS